MLWYCQIDFILRRIFFIWPPKFESPTPSYVYNIELFRKKKKILNCSTYIVPLRYRYVSDTAPLWFVLQFAEEREETCLIIKPVDLVKANFRKDKDSFFIFILLGPSVVLSSFLNLEYNIIVSDLVIYLKYFLYFLQNWIGSF